ncbi:hypothetical protein TcWFU_000704 [Taenia crassiceps]|uniref:Uncharacterized protein n=1 Tax=Taenia crassiceps TaxID=6207 RepID=A0ABR4QNV0_9CEST
MISMSCIQLAERRIPLLLAFAIACAAVSYAYPKGKGTLDEKILMEVYPPEALGEYFGESEALDGAGGAAYFWKPTYSSPFWKRSNFWKRYGNQAFWKRHENFW